MKWIFVLFSLVCSCYCEEYEFPSDFKFGVATAAYQVEGAWNESGKGENIWDRLTHSNPGAILDQSNGDVACDTYHKTKEDVQLLKEFGVDFYRFSISWSRILPSGKIDYINPDGIRYYNELIDELLANGIEPMITMLHFDLPQPLEDEDGMLNIKIADYFVDYADVLFENFGDRVKEWITFNEGFPFCYFGYGGTSLAPRRDLQNGEIYECGRTLLVAHAKVYHLYNEKYREAQRGRVGITNNQYGFEALNDNDDDREAAEIAMEYYLGWFSHPLFTDEGDYPQLMKDAIARVSAERNLTSSKLPELTTEEIDLMRGSSDFFGLNHYTTLYCSRENGDLVMFYFGDIDVYCYLDIDREAANSAWLRVIPEGFRTSLNWIREHYDNPEVIVTENGYSNGGNLVLDCRRINYYNSYLKALLEAKYEDGCNISGYTAWSLMDNFEWSSGFTEKFGLVHVDFDDDDRPRTHKMSAYVYKNIMETGKIDWSYTPDGFPECDWTQTE